MHGGALQHGLDIGAAHVLGEGYVAHFHEELCCTFLPRPVWATARKCLLAPRRFGLRIICIVSRQAGLFPNELARAPSCIDHALKFGRVEESLQRFNPLVP